MALADALDIATQRWLELRPSLTADEIREIERMLAAAVHGASWDPNQLLTLLLAHASDDHPAWVALRQSTTRRGGALTPDLVLVSAARLRFEIERAQLRDPEPPDPQRVALAAEERLFTAPMADAQTRPRTEDVVILQRGSQRVAPTFQFAPDGSVIPSVAQVNIVLDALDDPWGVASWWLTPHAALHAIPADEVRVGNPDSVLAAARAIETLP